AQTLAVGRRRKEGDDYPGDCGEYRHDEDVDEVFGGADGGVGLHAPAVTHDDEADRVDDGGDHGADLAPRVDPPPVPPQDEYQARTGGDLHPEHDDPNDAVLEEIGYGEGERGHQN